MSDYSNPAIETVRERMNREFRADYWRSHEAQLAYEKREAELDAIQMSYIPAIPSRIAEQIAEIEMRIHMNETTYEAAWEELAALERKVILWREWYLF